MTAIQYTTKEQELFDFLYPARFNTHTIHRTAILAGGQYVHVMIIFTLCYVITCLQLYWLIATFISFLYHSATNEQGDAWNRKVQDMNLKDAVSLFSSDIFDQVDDPKNHLKSCITPEIMNRFTRAGAPPHELRLKVDDICIVLRNLSKRNGLSNNVSNFTQ